MGQLQHFFRFVFIFIVFQNLVSAQNKISGIVTDGYSPLKGVSILVEGTTNGTTTDATGKYTITASLKDILVFSYVGTEAVKIILEDVTRVLNVELQPIIEELEGVTVTSRKKKTQIEFARNFYSDPTIINTNAGYLSPDLVGYHLRVVDGKDLNPKAYDILDAISAQLPGTKIQITKGVKYLLPMSFRPGVNFEVDGHIWSSTNPPDHLDIRKVLRVALIYPENAVHIYGVRVGGPGVVVINTSDVNHSSSEDGNRPYDLAKLRDNLYANDALDQNAMLQNGPSYLKELYGSKNADTAFAVYKKYRPQFGTSYSFVLDTYRFFLEEFKDENLAETILENHKLLFKQDPLAIKALAYTHQSNGEFEKANELYKQLFVLRPNYVQSYLDLGNSYREMGDYKKAAQLFARFDYLSAQGYFAIHDTMVVSRIMDREFNNLLSLNGERILSKKQRNVQKSKDDFEGTRLVFEWNDGEAEF
jgi:tetratricopeptide (TPR) repeat protein